jgi:hypothetical protein
MLQLKNFQKLSWQRPVTTSSQYNFQICNIPSISLKKSISHVANIQPLQLHHFKSFDITTWNHNRLPTNRISAPRLLISTPFFRFYHSTRFTSSNQIANSYIEHAHKNLITSNTSKLPIVKTTLLWGIIKLQIFSITVEIVLEIQWQLCSRRS